MTDRLTAEQVGALEERFTKESPEDLLAWALQRFGPRVALSSSFGAEDVVLIHMLHGIDPRARILTLDTLRLPTETYGVIAQVRERYGIEVEVFHPDLQAVDRMARDHGHNCFYNSVDERKLCCGIRKIEPLGRALTDLDAWITGLRRDQAATRADVSMVELDEVHGGILKLNPLAAWTNDHVWDYIHANRVPYNRLHDQGYPSIGCAPCTRAVAPGEDPRAGRWWWEFDPEHAECGIHVGYPGPPAGGG